VEPKTERTLVVVKPPKKGGLLKKMKEEMGKALQGQKEIFKSCYS